MVTQVEEESPPPAPPTLEQIDMSKSTPTKLRDAQLTGDLLRGWAVVSLGTRCEMVAEARRHLAHLPPREAAALLREIEAVEVHCRLPSVV